jgi:Family of unknown function (DUF6186)
MYRTVTIIAFVCIIVSLLAIGRRERSDMPTLGQMLGFLMHTPTGRATTLASWVWVGWHFFGR